MRKPTDGMTGFIGDEPLFTFFDLMAILCLGCVFGFGAILLLR